MTSLLLENVLRGDGFVRLGLGQPGELRGANPPAYLEAHRLVRLARFLGPVGDAGGVAGAGALALEGDDRDHEEVALAVHSGLRLPAGGQGVGEDDLLVRHHLEIDALAGMLLAVRAFHLDRGATAGAKLLGDDPALPRLWRPPFGGPLGIDAVDRLRRRVDEAGDRQ